ncbi:FxsA family protein [Paenibacillus hexagrammi]|uniref:Membrane protein FxsA n=1 Tax=Paenibacillus hexagrammi TaxID=2908839 RepID=A0ABY3SNM8_9BACL|nr:FxsA family protein [Paenibacillus sp. YPD9-1]UJF34735.1 membrane protein FxsA [Paenibacillus sp. YPD9-1]
MYRLLLALFIVVPAVELTLLITLGHWIGGWTTFALILLSGFLGAYFAKREGKKVWEYAKYEWSKGQMPTQQLLDGICIFIGGLLMITPGIVTDILGFLLVLPWTRPIFKVLLMAVLQKRIGRRYRKHDCIQ